MAGCCFDGHHCTCYNGTSVSATGAVSDEVPIISVAAALETNEPANAVVLASSWPLAVLWLDVKSTSSLHFDVVESTMLQ